MTPERAALQAILAVTGQGKNRSRRVGYLPRTSANKYLREIEGIAQDALRQAKPGTWTPPPRRRQLDTSDYMDPAPHWKGSMP